MEVLFRLRIQQLMTFSTTEKTKSCTMYHIILQWLHEESLISHDSHYPWVGPQRSMLLTTIKKVCIQTYMYHCTPYIPSSPFITHTHFLPIIDWMYMYWENLGKERAKVKVERNRGRRRYFPPISPLLTPLSSSSIPHLNCPHALSGHLRFSPSRWPHLWPTFWTVSTASGSAYPSASSGRLAPTPPSMPPLMSLREPWTDASSSSRSVVYYMYIWHAKSKVHSSCNDWGGYCITKNCCDKKRSRITTLFVKKFHKCSPLCAIINQCSRLASAARYYSQKILSWFHQIFCREGF